MSIWTTILLFLLGLALIVKGGDWFLDGAVWIAEATGMPRFLIGATVVSLATTLPELTVSVTGVLQGETDLAVGNAVGSVSANLGLILGLSALCLPAEVKRAQFDTKAVLMTLAALVLAALCRRGTLALLPGLSLLAVFFLYLLSSLQSAREERTPQDRRRAGGFSLPMLSRFTLGLFCIVSGSRLLIRHGSALALLLGVPAALIGVTMVAVGTSLPELVTTVTAILKKEASLSVGNIIGANVIDLTLILPVCAAVSGGTLSIGPQTTALDLPVCLLLCCTAVLPPLLHGRFYRWQGLAMLGLYGVYLTVLMA